MRTELTTTKTYFSSFDYLRIFFAFSIVAWHTKLLGATGLVANQFNFNLKDFTYGSIFLLAVPLFVQISLFLYIFNRTNKENYFFKRIFNLGFLYLFWMSLLILIFYKEKGLANILNPEFWFSGGATPLYFLLILLILTLVTELILYLEKILSQKTFYIMNLFFLIVSVIAIIGKIYFFGSLDTNLTQFLMPHWSVLNFLPYVFSAIIFTKLYKDGILKKWFSLKWIIGLLLIITTIMFLEYRYLPGEIYLRQDGMIIPTYSRLSLILSTWLVFYLAIYKVYRTVNWIKVIAGLTLGVYILHIFVMNILAGLLQERFNEVQQTPFYFVTVLLVSLIITYFIKEKRIA